MEDIDLFWGIVSSQRPLRPLFCSLSTYVTHVTSTTLTKYQKPPRFEIAKISENIVSWQPLRPPGSRLGEVSENAFAQLGR